MMRPMFSRRHYKMIAEHVNAFISIPEPIQPVDVVSMLASMFKMDNGKFDERKFVEACGMRWNEYCQQ